MQGTSCPHAQWTMSGAAHSHHLDVAYGIPMDHTVQWYTAEGDELGDHVDGTMSGSECLV